MKIVIASGGNGESGASIAAKRHIDVMRNIEDLDIRVYSKFSDSIMVKFLALISSALTNKIKANLQKLYYGKTKRYFSVFPLQNIVTKYYLYSVSPDVVIFHWCHDGIWDISKPVKGKWKNVLYVHDEWLLTGGCHSPYTCQEFDRSCANCPEVIRNKSGVMNSFFVKKNNTFIEHYNYLLVPSSYLKDKILKKYNENEEIINSNRIVVIPNPYENA